MATDSFFDISGRVILITGAARVGCARDIQGLALFLASAASDFLTEAQIPIDRGAALGVAC
jgi:hypothetical protein